MITQTEAFLSDALQEILIKCKNLERKIVVSKVNRGIGLSSTLIEEKGEKNE